MPFNGISMDVIAFKFPWKSLLWWKAVLLTLVLVCSECVPVYSRPFQDDIQNLENDNDCDFTVWDNTLHKGVYNLAPSCAEGHIDWNHPYGALRISLEPKLQQNINQYSFAKSQRGSQNNVQNFEACFHAKTQFTSIKIHYENGADISSDLKPLVTFNHDSEPMEREICLTSHSQKPVVLYLEALPGLSSTTSGLVEIDYVIDTTNRGLSQEECSPCSEEEILQAVCTSDFVVIGEMRNLDHVPIHSVTDIHLEVSKVYRERKYLPPSHMNQQAAKSVVFPPSFDKTNGLYGSQHFMQLGQTDPVTNNKMTFTDSVPTFNTRHKVSAPHKCGIEHGAGQFLFVGKTRLKSVLLQCAPRLEEFEEMWREASLKGNNLCTLE